MNALLLFISIFLIFSIFPKTILCGGCEWHTEVGYEQTNSSLPVETNYTLATKEECCTKCYFLQPQNYAAVYSPGTQLCSCLHYLHTIIHDVNATTLYAGFFKVPFQNSPMEANCGIWRSMYLDTQFVDAGNGESRPFWEYRGYFVTDDYNDTTNINTEHGKYKGDVRAKHGGVGENGFQFSSDDPVTEFYGDLKFRPGEVEEKTTYRFMFIREKINRHKDPVQITFYSKPVDVVPGVKNTHVTLSQHLSSYGNNDRVRLKFWTGPAPGDATYSARNIVIDIFYDAKMLTLYQQDKLIIRYRGLELPANFTVIKPGHLSIRYEIHHLSTQLEWKMWFYMNSMVNRPYFKCDVTYQGYKQGQAKEIHETINWFWNSPLKIQRQSDELRKWDHQYKSLVREETSYRLAACNRDDYKPPTRQRCYMMNDEPGKRTHLRLPLYLWEVLGYGKETHLFYYQSYWGQVYSFDPITEQIEHSSVTMDEIADEHSDTYRKALRKKFSEMKCCGYFQYLPLDPDGIGFRVERYGVNRYSKHWLFIWR